MQLTNVLVMDLPDGRVRSLVAPCHVGPVRVPLSFDQRKHAAAGDRPGSWMALAFHLGSVEDLAHLPAAWEDVVRRHGTLRTAIVAEGDQLELAVTEIGRFTWDDVEAQPGEDTRRVVRRVFDAVCRPLSQPSYRLLVVEPEDGSEPRVLIGADHSHVDAWSLLVLVRDLSTALERHRTGTDASDGFPAPPFAAHTTELLCRPATPAHVVDRWRAIIDVEDGAMPRFPLPLGDISSPQPEHVEFRDVLDADGVRRLEEWCSRSGVRMIAAAVSAMTAVNLRLAGRPLRAVLPVHSRFEPRWADSVGWFITNSVLECASAEPRAGADAVASAIDLGSHPLESIMRPYGGMPERPGMFALSWLDYRRLPVEVPAHADPQHVSAVIRTDGVMAWFVVTATGLRVRVRYPSTDTARENVRAWLDGVVAELRERADDRDGAPPAHQPV